MIDIKDKIRESKFMTKALENATPENAIMIKNISDLLGEQMQSLVFAIESVMSGSSDLDRS